MTAGNLLATTVNWISGGPNNGYPSGAGYVDGDIQADAEYNTPSGLAVDLSGNYLLVADRNNNTVRVLDFTINTTSTLLTYTNYVVTTNIFSQPVGVAIDANYNIFVLNRGNGNNGTVLEFDNTSELIATNLANITNAAGLCLDPNDDIFITASNRVIEVTAAGTVTNLATITASNAQLQGIVYKHNGFLAVSDYGRNGILLINPGNGNVTTNAGFHGQGDFITTTDTSISNTATFFHPLGIAESGDGTLIVSDNGNSRIKAILANGSVTNVYGIKSNFWAGEQYPGFQDGTVTLPDGYSGVAARLPNGVVVAPDGSLYVSEDYYHILRHVTGAGFSAEPPPPPATPVTVTATVVTNAGVVEVNIQWSPSTSGNVTNYILSRATSSGGPYTIIDQTTGTTFTDTSVTNGTTYYYVVQAENSGGESGNSAEVSVFIPVPPPAAPIIGWYDFEGNAQTGFFSTIHSVSPGNPFITFNPINIAIDPSAQGLATYYITVPPATNNAPAAAVVQGAGAPVYVNNELFGSTDVNPLPALTLSNGLVTIESASVNGVGENSSVTSASFLFEVGPVTVNAPGGNAAQITLSDVTSNVVFYYTLDGTDPTNAPASQQIGTTNGLANLFLNGTTNILFEVRAIGFGSDANFLMSGISALSFTTANFKPNTISWGFASGECSSAFVGAAGQTFFAPVTLTMVAGVPIYSMQFNMTVASAGMGITNPAPAAGPFGFQSMLMQPLSGTSPPTYTNIPPYAFASDLDNDVLPPISITNLVYYNGSTNYVDLVVSNGNELAVGWVERIGFTNLYNTKQQTLITYSQAHDDLFPDAAVGEPNGVIAGAYFFKVSPAAVNGQQYQIQLNRPSATDDGVGAPGSSVFIFTGYGTNSAALGPGSLNAIKNVTVGTIPYLVGNVYPFGWFNAGDFGNSNLQSADVQQVFNSAVYGLNTPPYDPSSKNGAGGFTNVSDMYDAMDSCGHLGALDNTVGDEFFGYYTNGGPVTIAEQNALFSGNYSLINNMVFGDGQLDISDVYLTFLRSEFTNNFLWFQRLWTNGVRVAQANYAPGVIPAGEQASPGAQQSGTGSSGITTTSITNTPVVNFTAGDYQAAAGQTVAIPVNATVFGAYPLRMLMLNITVDPLDGSPALTSPISFAANPSLGTSLGSATPMESGSVSAGNFSAAWLPNNIDVTQVPGFTGTANIGTLYVTIPANATSSSSYAIHFDHASASPSGLLSFPRRTLTGLVTLSSRTNSYFGDGIPDSWRLRYFGTIYNQLSVSNANADGTSMNNWQKYQAGLDPTDPSSVLNEGFDQSMAQSQQDHVLYWPSVSGQTYYIKRAPAVWPMQWTVISTNIGTGSYMEIHDSSGTGSGYYYEVTTQ
jgi:sugar lactone lactonase YvrE